MSIQVTSCPACAAAVPPKPSGNLACGCGLCFETVIEDNSEYYQHYADDDSHMRLPKTIEEVKTSGLRREAMVQAIRKRLTGGRLLDVGSGWGAFMVAARECGFDVEGIEICHKAANFSASMLGILTHCDNFSQCPLLPQTFNVISFNHTLERLPDFASVLRQSASLLLPGGWLCGLTPNIYSYAAGILKENWPWFDPKHNHVHFSIDSLQNLLRAHGFDNIEVTSRTGDYDKNALLALIKAQVPDQDAELFLEKLNQEGQGEELMFFAQRV